MSSSAQRLLALDGLRAISILIVVISHTLSFAPFNPVPGGLGVTIFFFISGFIITRLMLEEVSETGGVDLLAFYQRRLWRLAPALLVYVAVSCAAIALVGGRTPLIDVLAAVLYFANYHGIYSHFTVEGLGLLPTPPLSITWSLAVEEHFYFLFPLLLVWLRRQPGRLQAVLVAFVVATLAWRLYLAIGVGLESLPMDRLYMATDTRLDSIAYGCLLSVMFHRASREPDGAVRRRLDRLSHPAALAAAAALLLLTLALRSEVFRQTLRYSIQGIALMPLLCALFWRDTAPRLLRGFLEHRAMVYIGALSYSLYLYHFLGLALAYVLPLGSTPARMAFTVVFGVVGALLSYYVIEKPVRRFGTRHLWRPAPRPPVRAAK